MSMSLGKKYKYIYSNLCGQQPNVMPWHYQWIGTRKFKKIIRNDIKGIEGGTVLNVGCGKSPYKDWYNDSIQEYTGIDIFDGKCVDIVIEPGETWPIENNRYDIIECHQVIEHVKDLDQFLKEIYRVIKPNGHLFLSNPFLFYEHGRPNDYRRLTYYGHKNILQDQFSIRKICRVGNCIDTIAQAILNELFSNLGKSKIGQLIKAFTLPLILPLTLIINVLAFVTEKLTNVQTSYLQVYSISSPKK